MRKATVEPPCQQLNCKEVATIEAVDADAIRDACISQETRKKYTGSINGIKKWIKLELTKADPDIAQFFDVTGDIDLRNQRYIYRLKRIALPVEYGDGMKQLFSGFRRREAEQNQSSSPKTSGKQPLTYSLYAELYKAALLRSDGGFSHLFLTSQWNLMCRFVSVQTLQTHHLLAKDDSVGAIFYKTKTNQEDTGPRDSRHLFANPFSPSTCWVTALGVYLVCNPRLQPGALFPGSDPKIRFGKTLSSLLQKDGTAKLYEKELQRLPVEDVLEGRVCWRCVWSIGGVQDWYFRYEAAGDQFLDRVVAGLPANNSDFAGLPPHFSDGADEALKSCIAVMFPGLAKLTIKLEYSETSWMKASGIPPHIELYKKIDKQQQSIDALPSMLEKRMENVLERKGVAAGNITQELLRSEKESLLKDIGLHRSNETEPAAISSSPARTYYTWGGKFHRLPKQFEFPSIDPLSVWRLWRFGDTSRDYPPFKGILSDDLDTPKKKATLSEWSMMMRHIINAIEEQTHQTLPEIRDEAHAVELFNCGYSMLKFRPSKRERRSTQIKLTTALRLICEADRSTTRSHQFKSRKRQAACSDPMLP
ncbi:LOW QUALITY PROTEIN: hypothetical protein PHMEG_00018539 [Phytophthora megakarya]|uniref:Uncharacterized protein n=1 Tax=Phytophthora megakarya TaxID=4795 RepID=A0A225VTV0_9STRA|nr:LOW QUALITY PROTEIN: hypothetical protein PHMEG_00018539 [Phytophthora megakarya]